MLAGQDVPLLSLRDPADTFSDLVYLPLLAEVCVAGRGPLGFLRATLHDLACAVTGVDMASCSAATTRWFYSSRVHGQHNTQVCAVWTSDR